MLRQTGLMGYHAEMAASALQFFSRRTTGVLGVQCRSGNAAFAAFSSSRRQQLPLLGSAAPGIRSTRLGGSRGIFTANAKPCDNSCSCSDMRDSFLHRHIGPNDADTKRMLEVVGVKTIEELVDQAVPKDIRKEEHLPLNFDPRNERYVAAIFRKMIKQNKVGKSFIGAGYYNTVLPHVIRRCLVENPSWYTAYTPYQAEISQGRLEGLMNYQTMITELTGMEIANASLLDEGTAAAEAMFMIARISGSGGEPAKKSFFVSEGVHPQTIEVLRTRAAPVGIEVLVGDHKAVDFSKKTNISGVLVQYPDTYGRLYDYTSLAEQLHAAGGELAVSADLLALTVCKPPSEMKADIVVGTTQRFGQPMGFGGPHAAYLATSAKNKRRLPGRIIGESIDSNGDRAYRMALATREQHIRRDKATSNICTAQALLANIAGMYGVYHGPEGLKTIAGCVHAQTQKLKNAIETLGYEVSEEEPFFDTLIIDTFPQTAKSQTPSHPN
eukprot:GHVU01083029.1.p1 GENE.GHVU01083029.1~~GHVU01083029.1.p1  ORF type:complete len:497 (+),score=96.45 GHVU01083029.1:322-1812(+)